jgi:hypothetical protein
MSLVDEYPLEVDRLLQLPPLQDEDPQATWAFRAVFLPSFHPECALSVFETPSGVQVRLRALERSANHYLAAIRSGAWGDPIKEWVEPALSCETQPVAAQWLPALYSLVDTRLDTSTKASGIDGITIRCEKWEHAGESWSGEAWSPSPTRYPVAWRFCQVLLDVGRASLTWERSRVALDAVGPYIARE